MGTAAAVRAPQYAMYQMTAPTFSDSYYDRFIDYIDRKDSTTKGYLTCLRQFAKWLTNSGITQPTRSDIKNYRQYLENSGLKPGTQQQYLRSVKQFFTWTACEGLYPNIADNIHSTKVRNDTHKKDALSREAVPIIADSIDRNTEAGKRLYAMYMLCITCGLRCCELHRADCGDIKAEGERTYLYVQGKGHDDKDAPVLLIPEVKEAIADYLNSRSDKVTAKAPLFVSTSNRSKGKRIATTTISTMLKKAMVNAGFNSDRITAHSLRHTSGTGAYKATGNIYLAQKHQRHADPATTEIYVHAEEREERETEKQVYDYYFKDSNTETARRETADLLNGLNAEQLKQVTEFINNLKKDEV